METEKIGESNVLISVIMPAYNAAKFIEQAIESVLIQTFKNFDLIVIDDCSTDNTYDLIKRIAETDNRVRVYRNEKNSGVSYTRNYGISLSNAEWIAFLDSDDMWKEDKLQKQVELSGRIPEATLLFTGSSFVNSEGVPYSYIMNVPLKISFKELLKQNVISCSSVMVKRQHLNEVKMQNDAMHEDFAVWLQILKKVPYAYGINEPLLIYRLSQNTKSSNKKKAAKMTYRVYRFMGLSNMQTAYNMFFYTVRSIKKYRAILRQN